MVHSICTMKLLTHKCASRLNPCFFNLISYLVTFSISSLMLFFGAIFYLFVFAIIRVHNDVTYDDKCCLSHSGRYCIVMTQNQGGGGEGVLTVLMGVPVECGKAFIP